MERAAGAVLGVVQRCAGNAPLPDQGSHVVFWSLPSLLPLQPTEGFVPLKIKFLTFSII